MLFVKKFLVFVEGCVNTKTLQSAQKCATSTNLKYERFNSMMIAAVSGANPSVVLNLEQATKVQPDCQRFSDSLTPSV